MRRQRTVIAGAGGSLGAALCRGFAQRGDEVIAIGRDARRLADELAGAAVAVRAANLSDPDEVTRVFADLDVVDTLVCNTGHLHLASFLETEPTALSACLASNAVAPFLCARAVAKGMVGRGAGTILFTGATASLRAGPRSAVFAAAKSAQRALAESLAKELGPRGVHVAHVVIDGKLRGARTAARFPAVPDADCVDPTGVAALYLMLAEQAASAWSFEIDVRPAKERW